MSAASINGQLEICRSYKYTEICKPVLKIQLAESLLGEEKKQQQQSSDIQPNHPRNPAQITNI